MLALATTTALTEPLPVPKPPGPGGSCPHGYIPSGSYCTPSPVAADAIAKPPNGSCPWGWIVSGSYCLRKPPPSSVMNAAPHVEYATSLFRDPLAGNDHQQMKAGVRPVSRPLSLPRGAAKSLASCRNNLNHPESF